MTADVPGWFGCFPKNGMKYACSPVLLIFRVVLRIVVLFFECQYVFKLRLVDDIAAFIL